MNIFFCIYNQLHKIIILLIIMLAIISIKWVKGIFYIEYYLILLLFIIICIIFGLYSKLKHAWETHKFNNKLYKFNEKFM